MAFTLPDLPFDPTQLAPFCSKETFEYHHGKHHAAYVTKLNDAVKGTEMENMALEDLIRKAKQEDNKAVFNNAAQHFNHSFFWNCMDPSGGGNPGEKLAAALVRDFESVDKFKEMFADTATKIFGSGWAWLAQNAEGKLEIIPMKDADTPLILDKKPLLTLDVWEHAYYIDHRNARPNFIKEFWGFVNWKHAEDLLS
jgi:Fe-Mn family superoxide dismutase